MTSDAPKAGPQNQKNQHGTAIDLGASFPHLTGKSLQINGSSLQAIHPDRYKQHGFHFNADNCIGCHACESACSEKNNLPPHLAFRKVGSIEGGSYPDVLRLNISMACNHCEDPVCLKGCPTLAYTKYVEYGAVLQDPDICFGCGYCTWVCPYNAPQLNPERGEVEKCNMCVDRLESGLKPACVSACLSNALDFGVIEEIPIRSRQAKLTIPGFPDPSITRPNIRFHQTRSLPETFQRGDNAPLHYRKTETGTDAFSAAPPKKRGAMGWGLRKMRSREDPLVAFTLLSQGVVGTFVLFFLLSRLPGTIGEIFTAHPLATRAMLFTLLGLQTAGLVMSTLHLGKPQYFYRAMNNLRHSWVSREIFTMGGFYHLMGAYTLVTTFPSLFAWMPMAEAVPTLLGGGAAIMGPLGLFCMAQCYRIKARPFWDHWHSEGAFYASALILGALGLGFFFGTAELAVGWPVTPLFSLLALILLGGLTLQAVSLYAHFHALQKRGNEAAVSRMLMLSDYGKSYWLRWGSLATLASLGLAFAMMRWEGAWPVTLWWGTLGLALLHEIVGRAMFYVLVVPTTHPAAFFWGNKVFETHARKSGLAAMPQTGVHPEAH